MLAVVILNGTFGFASDKLSTQQTFSVYVPPKAEFTQVVQPQSVSITIRSTVDLWLRVDEIQTAVPDADSATAVTRFVESRAIECRSSETIRIGTRGHQAHSVIMLTFVPVN